MNYVENVKNFKEKTGKYSQPIPTDIVGHALDLRTSPLAQEAFQAQEHLLPIETLSPEQKRLAIARTAGSMATRLAMASFYTPNVIPFVDLQEQEQTDVIHILASNYATAARDTNQDKQGLLLLNSAADPLSPISHKETREWVYRSRTANISLSDRLELMLSYANIVPGTFPKKPHTIAPIANNDATFTQAFGRDSVTDKELVDIKDMRLQLADDTAMMHYLDSINFKPGPSNDALAESVHTILTRENPNEQMIQWEVAYSLWKNHPDTYQRFKDYLHVLWPNRDFYPTFEVKSDSIKAMDMVGAYNPAELAHGDMMVRALGIISKQGVIADPIDAAIPFDQYSTQPHVRNKTAWVTREFLTRGEHILRGRVKF